MANSAVLGQLAVALDLDTKRFEKGLSEAYRQMEGFDQKQAAAMSTRSIAALSALGIAIAAVGAASIKAASDFEQYAVSFEVMTGSAEKGLALLNSLRDFANVTPFDTDTLAQSAKVLFQFGTDLNEVMPILKLLGDVSGGNSEKLASLTLAFGQMSSAGRLMGQDLLQMINAGFNPLQEISKRTGKSMSELKDEMEKGAISSGMVKQAFIDATAEGGRFFGMMDKQGKTTAGTFSTLVDTWGKVAVAIGDTLAPALKTAIDLMTILGQKTYEAGINAQLLNKAIDLNAALQKTEGLRKAAYGNGAEALLNRYLYGGGKNKEESLIEYKKALYEANQINADIQKIMNPPTLGEGSIDTNSGATKTKTKKGKSAETLRKEALALAERDLQNSLNKQLALNDYNEQEILRVKIKYAGEKIKIEEKYKGDVQGAIVDQLELQKELNKQIVEDKRQSIDDSTSYQLSNAEWTAAGEARIKEDGLRKQRDLYRENTREFIELDKQYQAAIKETDKAIYEEKKAIFDQQQEWITRQQQAEIDLETKKLEYQYSLYQDYYTELGRLSGQHINSLIKGEETFGQATLNILGKIIQEELKLMAYQAISSNFDRGDGQPSMAGTFLNAVVGSISLFDKGGIVEGTPAEHLMTIQQGGEMNLNHAQQQNLWEIVNGKKTGNSGQPVIVSNQFNIKTLDGKQAADVILEQKHLIQQVISDGIKNNNNGLRNTVRGASK